MTDTQGGEAAAVETIPQAAVEAALSSQDSAQERNWESEAKEMGWVPQDQFKGDPDKWRPADEFVRRGEDILPIVRSQNAKLHGELKELRETNERMARMFEKTLARERTEAAERIDSLKAEYRIAVKSGDDDKADQIDQQIESLKQEAKEAPKAKTYADFPDDYQPTEDSPEHNALRAGFMASNAWMVEEPDMADYAVRVSELNAAANPGIGFKANMKAVEAAVRKKFPTYFGGFKEAAANGHAAVDTGGNFPGAQPASDPLVAKLPREAVVQMKRDIAAKLYKTEKDWAKAYFS